MRTRSASSRWNAPRRLHRLFLALALGAAAESPAQEAQPQPAAPVIREIAFAGNETTQPSVMLREMQIKIGDVADPDAIERARQGVQDLGLFRKVSVHEEPVEAGVRLVFTVKEKHYILPLPRADASSDGGYAYGAQLRWDNVWGLNHTFYPYFERRKASEGDSDPETRDVQTRTQLRYYAPFVFGTDNTLSLTAGYFKIPYLTPDEYTQEITTVGVGILRKLTEGHRNQGWTAGTGVRWSEEHITPGAVGIAPEGIGHATALSANLGYRNLHFNVYSDDGVVWAASVETAREGVLSTYDLTGWQVDYARYMPVGSTPHQTFHVVGQFGGRQESFQDKEAFAIGGTETVRGYQPEIEKGDAYYALSLAFLRPVFSNSTRALVVLDAARAFDSPQDMNFDKPYASLGVGMRFRIQAFVSLDLELGVAWPLAGGPPRVFASKV